MGYGAAGLGFGMSQAFSGMGDALDRVVSRREQRDRYEQQLRLDARDRQDRLDWQESQAQFRREEIQRVALAAERAEALRREEKVAAAMERRATAEAEGYIGSTIGLGSMDFQGTYDPATNSFTGAQGTMRGPTQTPYVRRGAYDFSASPQGQQEAARAAARAAEREANIAGGFTPSGANIQTQRDPTPPDERRQRAIAVAEAINRLERYDPERADQIARQMGFGSAQEAASYLSGPSVGVPPGIARSPVTPSSRWDWGAMAGQSGGQPSMGGGPSMGQGFDPNIQARIDEIRRQTGG